MSIESHGVETYRRALLTTLGMTAVSSGPRGACSAPHSHTFLPSQGCTAMSVDICIALARLPEAYLRAGWSNTGFLKKPLPVPAKTRTPGHGYGFSWVRVWVALEYCSLHSPTYSGNSGRIPVGIPDSGWIPVGFRLGFRIPGGFRWDSGFRTVFNCYNVFVSTTA